MTRFVFVCPPYAGHLNPMLTLARELASRGHAAAFIGQSDAARTVTAAGMEFRPVGAATHPAGTLDRMAGRLARTTGLFGIGAVIGDVARTTDMLCREGPASLRDWRADAVVADQTEAAGGLLARRLGLSHVSVANALLINREPLVPPPFVGWSYDATEWGTKRNLGGYRVADLLMRPVRRVVERVADEWGLDGIASIEDCLSPTLQISQSLEGFDFPRRQAPSSLVHVGPLRAMEAEVFRPVDARPLVFCSLGTLQGSRFAVFAAVARACETLDLSLVIAHGGKLTPDEVTRLPGRPRVEDFVPQRAVIAQAAAVVTHGGLNTVLDALAAGVPLVSVPIAFEQGAIAARVERCGAGLRLPLRRVSAQTMTEALRRLLAASRYRDGAALLRREAERAGGVRRAADLVEAVTAYKASS